MIGRWTVLSALAKGGKSQTINGVVKLGENCYFKDLGITIGLISTSGERKGLSEIV